MFGRATITLGIGPHPSCCSLYCVCTALTSCRININMIIKTSSLILDKYALKLEFTKQIKQLHKQGQPFRPMSTLNHASESASAANLSCSFSLYCHYCNKNKIQLECGPMPNVMVALPNIGGALCSTPQSFADAHYYMPCSNAAKTRNPLKFAGVPQTTG